MKATFIRKIYRKGKRKEQKWKRKYNSCLVQREIKTKIYKEN